MLCLCPYCEKGALLLVRALVYLHLEAEAASLCSGPVNGESGLHALVRDIVAFIAKTEDPL